MKRYILYTVLAAGCLLLTGISNQTKAQQIGGGLVYGSEIENLGIKIQGVYKFHPQIRGAADFTYFFPEDLGAYNLKWWSLNANAHYLFDMDEDFSVYGLGGLNFVVQSVPERTVSIGFGQTATFGGSESKIGLNLGGGIEYPMDFGNLFGELKYTLSEFDQVVFTAGVLIPIGE